MRNLSTWWTEAGRLHVQGSFGAVSLIVAPFRVAVDGLVALDDVLPNIVKGLFERSDNDPDDLQYLIFGKLAGHHLGEPGVVLEVDVLQAMQRALVEYVDLGERHVIARCEQPLHRDLNLEAHLFDEGKGEVVELPSGIVFFHHVVPAEVRLRIRERADQRARVVDEAVAAHALRRAARNSAPEAA